MRIITGKFKSRLIKSPKGIYIRPTADRVKESLFGILGNFIIGKDVLDLFSGTGNLGIEALSRGAKSCVFVDNNSRCIGAIKKNLEFLNIEQNIDVEKKDALEYVKEAAKRGLVFDVIFIDPPYYNKLMKKTLLILDNYNIIKTLNILAAEHYKEDDLPLPSELKYLKLLRQEKYGGSVLSFYRRRSE